MGVEFKWRANVPPCHLLVQKSPACRVMGKAKKTAARRAVAAAAAHDASERRVAELAVRDVKGAFCEAAVLAETGHLAAADAAAASPLVAAAVRLLARVGDSQEREGVASALRIFRTRPSDAWARAHLDRMLTREQFSRAADFYAGTAYAVAHVDGSSEAARPEMRAACVSAARVAQRRCGRCGGRATPGSCTETLHLIKSRLVAGCEVPPALALSHRPPPGGLRAPPTAGDTVLLDLVYERDEGWDGASSAWGGGPLLGEDVLSDTSLHTSAACTFICEDGGGGLVVVRPPGSVAAMIPCFYRLTTRHSPLAFARLRHNGDMELTFGARESPMRKLGRWWAAPDRAAAAESDATPTAGPSFLVSIFRRASVSRVVHKHATGSVCVHELARAVHDVQRAALAAPEARLAFLEELYAACPGAHDDAPPPRRLPCRSPMVSIAEEEGSESESESECEGGRV